MNIFGVGGAEMVAIFIIMLVVAGPKRMVRWAYIAGKYAARLRQMWGETMAMVQREFDEAGIDVELPKEPPTRANFNKSVNSMVENAMKPVSDPLKETLDEATEDIKSVQKDLDSTAKSVKEASKATESTDSASPLGSWSSVGKSETTESSATNGSSPSLGSWSNVDKSD